MTRARAAAKAFEETLEELALPEDTPELQDPEALGRRAALQAVAETVWTQHLGSLLQAEEVKNLLGVATSQAVSELASRGFILALAGSGGRTLYPAFQFRPSGPPYSEVAKVIEILSGAVETPYTIASWFVSPQDLLDGETPTAWMRAKKDASQLLAAAERSAGELNL